MEEQFKPFTLEIQVNTLAQLEALWLAANSNSQFEDFIKQHPDRKKHGICEHIVCPLSQYWWTLHEEFKKYNPKL